MIKHKIVTNFPKEHNKSPIIDCAEEDFGSHVSLAKSNLADKMLFKSHLEFFWMKKILVKPLICLSYLCTRMKRILRNEQVSTACIFWKLIYTLQFGALYLGKEIFTAIQIFQCIAPTNWWDLASNKSKPLEHSGGLGLTQVLKYLHLRGMYEFFHQ